MILGLQMASKVFTLFGVWNLVNPICSLKKKLLPDTERVIERLSRMKGNFQVRFLEEGERVIALSYST